MRALPRIALLLILCPAARADFVVAPNGYESVAGNVNNRFPLNTRGMRYQQVFNANQFAAFAEPTYLNQIAFRNAIDSPGTWAGSIADLRISLSTTAAYADGLSSTFASNVGADATQVVSGTVSWVVSNNPGPGNTKAFDLVINFGREFLYDPTQGNLLLDITNVSGTSPFNIANFLDAVDVTGDGTSRVFGPDRQPNATTGEIDSQGLIVRFGTGRVVPEPATVVMLGLGLAGVAGITVNRRMRGR